MSALGWISVGITAGALAAICVVGLLVRLGIEPLHHRANALREASGKSPRAPWLRRRAVPTEERWNGCDATFDCVGTGKHFSNCPRLPPNTRQENDRG